MTQLKDANGTAGVTFSSLDARLTEHGLSVSVFGAVGDGVTDDTAAIQATIDWVEANLAITKHVFVPAGNYIVSGITLEFCSLTGHQSSRAVAGLSDLSTNLGTRLIHKAGATTPMITVSGGFASHGFEHVKSMTLQGKQNQNVAVPKRPIVSSADRRHFFVAPAHTPPALNITSDFPGYGVCVFYDSAGYKLGMGVVETFDPVTGEITLFVGTDNYTGKVGSGNLMTATETVAFSPAGTWTSVGFTFTNYPDHCMISPPAILIEGRSKIVDDVYIRDFHVGILCQESICHLGKIWTNNCGLAGIAMRAVGSGADISGDRWFIQGGSGTADMGQADSPVAKIDQWGAANFCCIWGLPSRTNIKELICNMGYHGIVDRGGLGINIGFLTMDLIFKEGLMSYGGSWISGSASPVLHVNWFEAVTTTPTYIAAMPSVLNYPSGERSVMAIKAGTQRVIDVDTISVMRFDSAATSANDWDCIAKITQIATLGAHDIRIKSIPWSGGAKRLGVPVSSKSILQRRGLIIEDDFDGAVLKAQWVTYKGTDAEALLPAVTSSAGGNLLLQGGDDAAGTVAINGSRIETARQWQPGKGNLAFEVRVASNVSALTVFLGLTNSIGALTVPFELVGTTLTSAPIDAVGFLYDSRATTVQWHAVGVKNNVDATRQALGSAPTGSSAYQVLRVEITPAGVATFFIDRVQVGTAMVDAVSDVILSPVAAMFSNTAAIRQVVLDYVICEQDR